MNLANGGRAVSRPSTRTRSFATGAVEAAPLGRATALANGGRLVILAAALWTAGRGASAGRGGPWTRRFGTWPFARRVAARWPNVAFRATAPARLAGRISPSSAARVLGVLARGVLGLLTRTFDFRTGAEERRRLGADGAVKTAVGRARGERAVRGGAPALCVPARDNRARCSSRAPGLAAGGRRCPASRNRNDAFAHVLRASK